MKPWRLWYRISYFCCIFATN